MAAINHTDLAAAVRQLCALATAATGEAPEGAAARYAVLGHCAVMLADAVGPQDGPEAVSVWRLLTLLELMEDSAPGAVDGDNSEGIYKAIAQAQEALSVPEDARAWAKDREAAPALSGVCYAKSALSLLPMLREAVCEELARNPEKQRTCRGLLDGVGAVLAQSVNAKTEEECGAALEAADVFLGEASTTWEAVDAPKAWGLYYGIGEAIRLGREASTEEMIRAGSVG